MAIEIKRFNNESSQSKDTIITLEDLTLAIESRMNLHREIAEENAGMILDYFPCFNDRLVDNVLEPEDRHVFYILEEAGLVSTGREEHDLPTTGQQWRTHYWILRPSGIKAAADRRKRKLSETDGFSVYAELPDEIWTQEGRKKLKGYEP